MKNNNQIDNTDYYRLPCGKYLEDFIAWRKLDFASGSALKYLWRAGKKDGESADKDLKKVSHYVNFIARRCKANAVVVTMRLGILKDAATKWNGDETARPE